MHGQAVNAQSARDRAASHITNKYGAAAANSVSQLQAHPQAQQQYPQMHANGQMPHIKQEPGYPSMGHGQTDGASDTLADWKAEVARRREAAQNGQGDRMLREHLNQQMLSMEGGGLLRPLSEQRISTPASRHAVACLKEATALQSPAAVPRLPGQFDGADDLPKEEEDEDAINSDLDDPDDLIAEDHDADESEGQVMLCTYDKVQRVKNKWKCTLKDGILTTGGRE
jgi:transcription initiation factor TFIIA large subunit